ncbi:hypothetical protein J3R83DRAFT_8421 [Lanmaoa asiatica]|nr:hypothetical protein J3R83DRAFT_8421 [Lanmaoa asiatica]
MPRGIPNPKKDDFGMRYTSMHVPLAPNPKHMGTSYLKSESQTLWSRNAARKQKIPAEDMPTPLDQRRGSQVVVIHPGSRYLRIGKASDVTPITVPNVIARKHNGSVPEPEYIENIARPRKGRNVPSATSTETSMPSHRLLMILYFEVKLVSITVSLRERMRFYKLRVTPKATSIASTFNEQFKPEIIPEQNDPFRVDWIDEPLSDDAYLVGDKVLRMSDPQALNYTVRWPIHGQNFNSRDYPSVQMILDDVETIISNVLEEKLDIKCHDFKNYSVVLVIPDFYDRVYIREFVNILLMSLGFKQICVQQESLAATYGAGISNACIVDIGAVKTSVACVDEGLVIPDSRMSLNMGGNDITEFLYVLLERINFPYREINLARWYDWSVMEDLKSRLCTLAEVCALINFTGHLMKGIWQGDVALNLYDFVVRRYGHPTEKYGLRAYDEIILAPMCIFEPRVIEFDRKRVGLRPTSSTDVTEEIVENQVDHVTQAMIISTQHLLPSPPSATDGSIAKVSSTVPSQGGHPANPTENGAKVEQQDVSLPSTANPTPPPTAAEPTDRDAAMVIEVEREDKTPQANPPAQPAPQVPPQPGPSVSNFPGGLPIDVCSEASKLPLDVAIFNSTRACGGDEKIRKYLQAVLVIGGGAQIPGMAHALESRLQAIATPLVANMDKVQIIPPPKDVDPKVLAWKGAAVLGKMDSVGDLWLTLADWDVLGMRGLKERCFYL